MNPMRHNVNNKTSHILMAMEMAIASMNKILMTAKRSDSDFVIWKYPPSNLAEYLRITF